MKRWRDTRDVEIKKEAGLVKIEKGYWIGRLITISSDGGSST